MLEKRKGLCLFGLKEKSRGAQGMPERAGEQVLPGEAPCGADTDGSIPANSAWKLQLVI